MIRFHLKCANNHEFESWFQSGAAFEKLQTAGMVTCDTCGSHKIAKTLMAPQVQTAPAKLRGPAPDVQARMAKLRAEIEAKADNVGLSFAAEARAMHLGDKPERAIYGQASGAEARELLADGVPVMPLPFIPGKKAH